MLPSTTCKDPSIKQDKNKIPASEGDNELHSFMPMNVDGYTLLKGSTTQTPSTNQEGDNNNKKRHRTSNPVSDKRRKINNQSIKVKHIQHHPTPEGNGITTVTQPNNKDKSQTHNPS